MRPRVDLHLVANTLRSLDDSAYFDERVHKFTGHFIGAIEHVLANPGKYDTAIEATFAYFCRTVRSHLTGDLGARNDYFSIVSPRSAPGEVANSAASYHPGPASLEQDWMWQAGISAGLNGKF